MNIEHLDNLAEVKFTKHTGISRRDAIKEITVYISFPSWVEDTGVFL